jgi:NADH:ubiquinone oxidoreductase subunit F (NADH-binding)
MDAAGWFEGVAVDVFEGPDEYLYGEETALLEAIDGRPPFPRVAPPFREGIHEPDSSAEAEMAGATDEPPVLVDNVETLANVPAIVANGAAWFREVGTEESPGTIVCTVTGATQKDAVGEVAMGTPVREVIDAVGGGALPGHEIMGVLSGVSASPLPGDALDTPASYEAMAAAGAGLGSGSFIVIDDHDDPVAVAAAASRFLAVESCGQCVPCKRDGLDLADRLAKLANNEADHADVKLIAELADTVSDEARCALARQHEAVVKGFLARFPDAVDAHLDRRTKPAEPVVIAELLDVKGGVAVVDEEHTRKQPDWTYSDEYSGKFPAEIY